MRQDKMGQERRKESASNSIGVTASVFVIVVLPTTKMERHGKQVVDRSCGKFFTVAALVDSAIVRSLLSAYPCIVSTSIAPFRRILHLSHSIGIAVVHVAFVLALVHWSLFAPAFLDHA